MAILSNASAMARTSVAGDDRTGRLDLFKTQDKRGNSDPHVTLPKTSPTIHES